LPRVQPKLDPKRFRRRFIEAAWTLGASRGADAVKIRDIAEYVGVSAALIYSYFEDKASLMSELQAVGAERFDALVAERSQRDEGCALICLCECYLEYMREHGWLYEGSPGLSADCAHVRSFVRRASALLGTDDDDARGVHLWIAVQGFFAARTCAPQLTERIDVREHLGLWVDALRQHRRLAAEQLASE
jgi:AcrR family transcriptional regulator